MRYGLVIFCALMFAVVAGVIFPVVMEYPLELYYQADVDHIASHYSYKPGQSGVEYKFYKASPGGGYTQISLLTVISVATIFYFGVFSLLAMLRRLILNLRFGDKNSSGFKSAVLSRIKLNTHKQRLVMPDRIISVLLVLVFFFLAAGNTFGNQNSKKPDFAPTDIVYLNNGRYWVIDVQTEPRGVVYLKDGTPLDYDSTIVSIATRGKKNREIIYRLRQNADLSRINFIYKQNKIWLIGFPAFLRILDTTGKELSTLDEFRDRHRLLDAGIHETVLMSDGRFRLNLLDGLSYYYDFDNDTLLERLSSAEHEWFRLNHEGSDRWDLEYRDSQRKQIAANDPVLIDAEIVYQNPALCITWSKKDISDDSEGVLTCMDSTGRVKWRITTAEFPEKPGIDPEDKHRFDVKTAVDGDLIIVNTSIRSKLTGTFAAHIPTGEIRWKFNYTDL